MSFLDLLISNKLDEAKDLIVARLNEISSKYLEEAKKYAAADRFDLIEEPSIEELDEVAKRNPNIINMGRVRRIRKRIRRNKKGRITVQKNRRRSRLKGYKISGNTVRRIPATTRLKKARLLRRAWKTTRRAKLRRSLIKRRMSLRRRSAMGLK
jgi:hypothetical protein|tara:strand:+ start:13625 stop:14086 length:462 start_codon:yes stop_codon:yes gene_type:complete